MSEDIDDFDLDSDFGSMDDDFENFEMEAMDQEETRDPIVALRSNLFRGAVTTATDRTRLRDSFREAVPTGYNSAVVEAQDGYRQIDQARRNLIGPIRRELPEFKRNLNRLSPMVKRIVGDRFGNKFDEMTKVTDSRATTEAESNALEIRSGLASVFGTWRETQLSDRENDLSDKFITGKTEEERFRANHELMVKLVNSARRAVSFNDNVIAKVHEQSLELDYKKYHVLRSILKVTTEGYNSSISELKAITKNTGLPDIIKRQNSENFRQLFLDEWQGRTTGTIVDAGRDYLGAMFKNIQTRAAEAGESLAEGMGSIGGAADSMASMDEMQQQMSEMDPTPQRSGLERAADTATEMGGGVITKRIMESLTRYLRQRFQEDEASQARGTQLEYMIANKERLLDDYIARGAEGDGLTAGLFRFLDEMRPTMESDREAISNSLTARANQEAVNTRMTQETITSVIPGWLGKIHHSLEQIRTGDENQAPQVYDPMTESFTTRESAAARLQEALVPESSIENIRRDMDETIAAMFKSNEAALESLTKSQLELLEDTVLRSANNVIGTDLNSFKSSNTYSKVAGSSEEDAQVLSTVMQTILNEEGVEANRRNLGIVKSVNQLKASNTDAQKIIDQAGYTNSTGLLEDLGYAKRDSNGRLVIDHNRLYDRKLGRYNGNPSVNDTPPTSPQAPSPLPPRGTDPEPETPLTETRAPLRSARNVRATTRNPVLSETRTPVRSARNVPVRNERLPIRSTRDVPVRNVRTPIRSTENVPVRNERTPLQRPNVNSVNTNPVAGNDHQNTLIRNTDRSSHNAHHATFTENHISSGPIGLLPPRVPYAPENGHVSNTYPNGYTFNPILSDLTNRNLLGNIATDAPSIVTQSTDQVNALEAQRSAVLTNLDKIEVTSPEFATMVNYLGKIDIATDAIRDLIHTCDTTTSPVELSEATLTTLGDIARTLSNGPDEVLRENTNLGTGYDERLAGELATANLTLVDIRAVLTESFEAQQANHAELLGATPDPSRMSTTGAKLSGYLRRPLTSIRKLTTKTREFFTRRLANVTNVKERVKATATSLTNLTAKPLKFAGKVLTDIRKELSTPLDIYVTGNPVPVLLGKDLKRNSYYNRSVSGKVNPKRINSLEDIEGEVVDAATGNIAITLEEFNLGLYTRGKAATLGTNLAKAARNVTNLAVSSTKSVLGFAKRNVTKLADKLTLSPDALRSLYDATGKLLVSKADLMAGKFYVMRDGKRVTVTSLADITSTVFSYLTEEPVITEDNLREKLRDKLGNLVNLSNLVRGSKSLLAKAGSYLKRGANTLSAKAKDLAKAVGAKLSNVSVPRLPRLFKPKAKRLGNVKLYARSVTLVTNAVKVAKDNAVTNASAVANTAAKPTPKFTSPKAKSNTNPNPKPNPRTNSSKNNESVTNKDSNLSKPKWLIYLTNLVTNNLTTRTNTKLTTKTIGDNKSKVNTKLNTKSTDTKPKLKALPKFNTKDSDGNGLRDNGWREKLKLRKESKGKGKVEIKARKPKKGKSSLFKMIAGLLGPLVGFVGSLVGAGGSLVKGILTKAGVVGAAALSSMKLLGGNVGPVGVLAHLRGNLRSISGRSKAILSSGTQIAKKATTRLTGALTGRALLAGGSMLAGAGALGAGAAAGAAFLAPVIGIALTAWTAYSIGMSIYGFMKRRAKVHKLEYLRLLSYGYFVGDEGEYKSRKVTLRYFEDEMLKRMGATDKGVAGIRGDSQVLWEEYSGDFGSSVGDEGARVAWIGWLENRFKPVFFKWLTLVGTLNSKGGSKHNLDTLDGLGEDAQYTLAKDSLDYSYLDYDPLERTSSAYTALGIQARRVQVESFIKQAFKQGKVTPSKGTAKDTERAKEGLGKLSLDLVKGLGGSKGVSSLGSTPTMLQGVSNTNGIMLQNTLSKLPVAPKGIGLDENLAKPRETKDNAVIGKAEGVSKVVTNTPVGIGSTLPSLSDTLQPSKTVDNVTRITDNRYTNKVFAGTPFLGGREAYNPHEIRKVKNIGFKELADKSGLSKEVVDPRRLALASIEGERSTKVKLLPLVDRAVSGIKTGEVGLVAPLGRMLHDLTGIGNTGEERSYVEDWLVNTFIPSVSYLVEQVGLTDFKFNRVDTEQDSTLRRTIDTYAKAGSSSLRLAQGKLVAGPSGQVDAFDSTRGNTHLGKVPPYLSTNDYLAASLGGLSGRGSNTSNVTQRAGSNPANYYPGVSRPDYVAVGNRVTIEPLTLGQPLGNAEGLAAPHEVTDKVEERISKYNGLIYKASQAKGIDEYLLRSVIRQESAGIPTARSPVGAVGLMQLMPATAKELGVTNRNDPEQSIMGGAEYIHRQLKRFEGKPELALAAYNAGGGNVNKAIRLAGTTNPEAVLNALPQVTGRHSKETQDYVVKITNDYRNRVGDSSTQNTTVTRVNSAPRHITPELAKADVKTTRSNTNTNTPDTPSPLVSDVVTKSAAQRTTVEELTANQVKVSERTKDVQRKVNENTQHFNDAMYSVNQDQLVELRVLNAQIRDLSNTLTKSTATEAETTRDLKEKYETAKGEPAKATKRFKRTVLSTNPVVNMDRKIS